MQVRLLPPWILFVALALSWPHLSFATSQPNAALQELVASLEAVRRKHNVPAVALTVVSHHKLIWSGALGLADIETNKPATADTLFRIGSITKAFTALAFLLLQEEGRLALDDRLMQHAPEAPLSNPWKATHPVRLAHLLEHTAGLLDIDKAEFDSNDPKPLTLAEALAFSPDARVSQWRPGLHSSYSNAGAGLAAYALEKLTGQTYEDFVEERLFRPLGMHSAGFFLDERTERGLATGYDRDGVTVIPYWHTIFRPFGAINATPREMAGFVLLLLNRGTVNGRRLIGEASIRRMETPETTLAAKSGLSYGYGLGNYQFIHKGFVFHGHGGDGDGYLAHYAYNRDSGIGYFVVINAFHGEALSAIRALIQDYIVHGLDPPSLASAQIESQQLARLAGIYEPATYRFPWRDPKAIGRDTLRVIWDSGKLYTQTNSGKKHALISVNRHHFRRAGEPVATTAFVEYKGELYLQGDMGNYRRIAEPSL